MYTRLAIGYNDAVRGKINQSLNGITEELCHYAPLLMDNIDRVYVDDPKKT